MAVMPPEARTARTVSVQVDAPDALLRAGRGRTDGGLSQRELDVLRLLAEGYSTVEIGRRLAYSERTIKHTLHQLTTRLALRNRVHAVAYALRAGLI